MDLLTEDSDLSAVFKNILTIEVKLKVSGFHLKDRITFNKFVILSFNSIKQKVKLDNTHRLIFNLFNLITEFRTFLCFAYLIDNLIFIFCHKINILFVYEEHNLTFL